MSITINNIIYSIDTFNSNFAVVTGYTGSPQEITFESVVKIKKKNYTVVSINNSVFKSLNSLTSIVVPTTITFINSNAFESCQNLTNVSLSSGLLIINDYAFARCSSLISINIPSTVIDIGKNAFERCSALISINIPNSVKTIGEFVFTRCSNLASITLSNNITKIKYASFWLCENLTSVTLPNSLTTIEASAFSSCSKLTSINLPNTLKTIDSYAFNGCSSLSSIDIPIKVVSIGNKCFDLCPNLISVSIQMPSLITTINTNSFTNVSNNPISIIRFFNTDDFNDLSSTWKTISGYYTNTIYPNGKVAPTIGSLNIPEKTFVDSSFQITHPTSNSNGTFSYTSSNTNVATIQGNIITIIRVGTSIITATQSPSGNFTGGSVSTNFVVNKAMPVIMGFSIPNKTFGDNPFAVNPTSTSSGAFTYTSSNTSVATVQGNIITIVGTGSVSITAEQAETNNYTSKNEIATFSVSKATPIITEFYIPNKTFNDNYFDIINPTSTSNGTFSYASSNLNVATIKGNTITIVGAGNTIITAYQSGTENYEPASVATTFVVNKDTPTLTDFFIPHKTVEDGSFDIVNPVSTSDGTFSYFSSNLEVATVEGNTITIIGSGVSFITAVQEATNNYASASIDFPFIVNQTFKSNFLPFAIIPPISNSDGAFVYSSLNERVAIIEDGIVKIVGAGEATIRATQLPTNKYLSNTIDTTFTVEKATPSLVYFNIPNRMDTSPSFTLTPPITNSTGTFSYVSSNEEVATIVGNVVTIHKIGQTTITATVAESIDYYQGEISTVFEVVIDPAQTYFYYDDNTYDKTGDSILSASYYNSTKKLLNVQIGTSVVELQDNCFSNVNVEIVRIDIPKNLTTLGNYCFNSFLNELHFVNSQTITSVGSNSFSNMKNGIDVYYNNAKNAESLPIVLTNSQSQFDNPTFYYNNILAVKFTNDNFTSPLSVQTQTTDPNVEYMQIIPKQNNFVVTSFLQPLASMAVNALDSNGNFVTDLGNNPVQYSIELPGIPATNSVSFYKLDPNDPTSILDPQPPGYPAPLTYNEATGLWDTLLPSLSDFVTLAKLDPNLSDFFIPNQRIGDDIYTIVPPTSLSSGEFTYTSSDETIATIINSNQIFVLKPGACIITATQTSTDTYNSAFITAEFTVGQELFEYNNISSDMTVNISMKFNITQPNTTLILPLTNFSGRIFWGDGSTKQYLYKTNSRKTYTNAGNYVVSLVDVTNLPEMGMSIVDENNLVYRNSLINFTYNVQIPSLIKLTGLFEECSQPFTFNVGNVNVMNNVVYMDRMFYKATSFNSPMHLNINMVNTLADAFGNTTSFKGPLILNNIENLADATGMLDNSGLLGIYYSNLLSNWTTYTVTKGVNFGAQNMLYNNTNGLQGRDILTNSPNGWIITGDEEGPSPSIDNVNPSSAQASTLVTISGENFNYNPVLKLNDVQLSVQSFTNNQIQFILPEGFSSGTFVLSIITDVGIVNTNFTYLIIEETVIVLPSNQQNISGLFSNQKIQLTPSSNSNASFNYSSSNTTVANVSVDGIVNIIDSGTAIIIISQNSTNFYTAKQIVVNINILENQSVINVDSNYIKNPTVNYFNLGATSNNILTPILYSSSDTSIAIVDTTGNVTLTGATGRCIINMSQVKIKGWSTDSKIVTMTIGLDETIITNFFIFEKTLGDMPFKIKQPNSNNIDKPFIYNSLNNSVATIQEDIITIVGVGTAIITARQDSSEHFTEGIVETTFIVNSSSPENPLVVNNSEGLLYFLNTNSQYVNINSSIKINYDLKTNKIKTLKGNNVTITKL